MSLISCTLRLRDNLALKIITEFGSGGLESLFSNQKQIQLALPSKDEAGHPANMDFLIRQLDQKHLKGRKDFFIVNDAVFVTLSDSESEQVIAACNDCI